MNVLLLGNGFDLNHNLPTKYINFIHTLQYLAKTDITKIKTIGDVFGNIKLQKQDNEINKSYAEYKDIYDSIEINSEELLKLSDIAKNNMWFTYLSESFNKDIGWIDFEEEISTVIHVFQELFENDSIKILFRKRFSSDKSRAVIYKFKYFFANDFNKNCANIKPEYAINYLNSENNQLINKNKIIETLLSELKSLADGLKSYLNYFVENILEKISETKTLKWETAFNKVEIAITFNYTNTLEKLYNKCAFHLHGNVEKKIILGVSPDSFDNIETIDTAFLSFKKYFQRVINKTDIKYLEFIKDLEFIKEPKEAYEGISIYIIGHSLDSTDADIIKELFLLSSNIYVLNYDEKDEAQHISNLIKIFGKDGFDNLRFKHNLTFLSIDADLSNIM